MFQGKPLLPGPRAYPVMYPRPDPGALPPAFTALPPG